MARNLFQTAKNTRAKAAAAKRKANQDKGTATDRRIDKCARCGEVKEIASHRPWRCCVDCREDINWRIRHTQQRNIRERAKQVGS